MLKEKWFWLFGAQLAVHTAGWLTGKFPISQEQFFFSSLNLVCVYKYTRHTNMKLD